MLAACSSSKKDDPTPPPPAGMSWTVDGMAMSAATTQVQKNSSTLYISGTASSGIETSLVSLEMPMAVGTYPFDPTLTASSYYRTSTSGPNGNTIQIYVAGDPSATTPGTITGSGTIAVTSLSATNVSGTFTFTAINPRGGLSKAVTNGAFNLSL